MTTRTVETQAELDTALADKAVDYIVIDSPRGVWIYLRAYGSATVSASGSATVRAYGSATVSASGSATVRASDSATVRASGSATVHASGSATVRASDSATVHASGSATVRAYGSATVSASGSATVRASDSATVRASGSATVHASGSATVRAYDTATVHAYDSATVRASDSATVSAYGSATVSAYGSATVSAGKCVAVHLHSQRVTINGGVVIDMTAVDYHDATSWCELQGVDITDNHAIVYKAVNVQLRSSHAFAYPIGETVTDLLWAPTDACGAGLHFGATPHQADAYYGGADARYLACRIPIADACGITGSPGDTAKIKARTCEVLYEVDIHGRKIEAAS